jgi:hypothetical protein
MVCATLVRLGVFSPLANGNTLVRSENREPLGTEIDHLAMNRGYILRGCTRASYDKK